MWDAVEPIQGFNEWEHDKFGPFIWSQATFRLRLNQAASFACFKLCYHGQHGTLSISHRGHIIEEVSLTTGWQSCALRLGAAQAGDELDFAIAPIISVPHEIRTLGIALRQVELIDDERRFEMVVGSQQNLLLNDQELREGAVTLESYPPLLRVTMEVRCNIPETGQACVYCAWDWAKLSERGSPAFQLDTLDQLGDFYRSATHVNDCSVGEPTMHKQFGAIVEQIDRDGKQFSLTTNGQLLSPKRRRELLGKNVNLYVSIDSATAEGYARYRNDRFDDIIANLRALCREKKEHGNLPQVFVSFILMRSNVDELAQFFELMADVGVDEVKLRMLALDDNLEPQVVNNGYAFDYLAEILRPDEVADIAPQARELAQKHGLRVYVDADQFETDQGCADGPLCAEPWRAMYILRRGIMPCCYATEPVARWHERGGRPLDEFLRDVQNGPQMQEIRRELAAGRLSEYCRNTPSCPILKRQQQAGLIDVPLNDFQRQMCAGACDAPRTLPLVPLESLHHADRANSQHAQAAPG